MFDPLLAAFTGGGTISPFKRRLWLLFLLGAPVALAATLYFQARVEVAPDLQFTITREQAIETARALARPRGLPLEGWGQLIVVDRDLGLRRYLDTLHLPSGHPAYKLGPRASLTVLLHSPDFLNRWRVRLAGDGRVLAFDESGPLGGRPSGISPGEAAERERLEQALREGPAAGVALNLGEPEVQNLEGPRGIAGRLFTWHAALEGLPGVDFMCLGEMRGDRITRLEVNAVPRPGRQAAQRNLAETLGPIFELLRVVFLVAIGAYACYRFARRAAENEVPGARALLLFLFMSVFGIILVVADPDLSNAVLDLNRLSSSYLNLVRITLVAMLAVQGLLLGLAYASGEGEIREGFPGKLTSLDTALTGRLFSQNAAASVLFGTAAACWLAALFEGVLRWGGADIPRLPPRELASSFSLAPGMILFLRLPMIALFSVVCGLMLPLVLLRRKVRAAWMRAVLLLLAAFLGATLGGTSETGSLHYWVYVGFLAVAMLAPFFVQDLLASIVTTVGFSFLIVAGELTSLVPTWRAWLDPLWTASAGTLGAFAWAAWQGRRYEDSEVRPHYAHNVARRAALQAEIAAAREAQMRLLPKAFPTLAGLSLAASCTPAGDVGGDFYDFYPLPGGRLGFVLAEGGNDGLASALTIALAKGFLQVEVAFEDSPTKVLEALDEVLGANLVRTSGSTMLAYGAIDPLRRSLRLARLGEYPRLHTVSNDGTVTEILPKASRSSSRVGEIVIDLAAGDLVVAYTDGIPHRLAAQSAGSPDSLLRRAAGWQSYSCAAHMHDAVRRILLPDGEASRKELNDDLTLLVVQLDQASDQTLEEVA